MPIALAWITFTLLVRFATPVWRIHLLPALRARRWQRWPVARIAAVVIVVLAVLAAVAPGTRDLAVTGIATVVALMATDWFLDHQQHAARVIPAPKEAPDLSRVLAAYHLRSESTEAIDHGRAERAMADIYRAAKAPPPAIFWARSPREAALAGLATNAFASVAVPSEARWGVVRTKPCGGAGLAEWADLVDRMSGMTNLDSLSRIRVEQALDNEALGVVWSEAEADEIRALGLRLGWMFGQTDMPSLSAISLALSDDGLVEPGWRPDRRTIPLARVAAAAQVRIDGAARLTPLGKAVFDYARLAGDCLLTDLGVIMVDHPTAISLDAHHRLHNEQGPSLTYADGWSVWALGGLGVPRVAIEDPGSLTVAGIQRVAHPSRHLALIGIYGHDRYVEAIAGSPDLLANEIEAGIARPALAALGETPFIQQRGQVVHADLDALGQPRRLWRAARRSDEALVMLEVVNSTAEPDGTYHHYYLRVPPRMLTCRDAVAWTFGLAGPQYAPLVES